MKLSEQISKHQIKAEKEVQAPRRKKRGPRWLVEEDEQAEEEAETAHSGSIKIEPSSIRFYNATFSKIEPSLILVTNAFEKKIEPSSFFKFKTSVSKFEPSSNPVSEHTITPTVSIEYEIEPSSNNKEFIESIKIEPSSNKFRYASFSKIEPSSIFQNLKVYFEIEPSSNKIEPSSFIQITEDEPKIEIEPSSNKIEPSSNDGFEPSSIRKIKGAKSDSKVDQRLRLLSKVMKNELVVLQYLRTLVVPSRGLETSPCSTREIHAHTGIEWNSIKTAIKRSLKKQIIKVSGFKNGKTGWTSYEFYSDAYIFFGKKNELGSNRVNELGSNSPSSSSSFLKENFQNPKTTTTEISRVRPGEHHWTATLDIPPDFCHESPETMRARFRSWALDEKVDGKFFEVIQESIYATVYNIVQHSADYKNPFALVTSIFAEKGLPVSRHKGPRFSQLKAERQLQKIEDEAKEMVDYELQRMNEPPAESSPIFDDSPF